jgi:hypothetical protein
MGQEQAAMWTYQYKHGDRPLEGYTIQRAAGRGGFGEVYYAVSDSGREVALKAILGYEQIELRGITQCMNLKSPHLVTVFDIKQNAEGRSFVIMEYVSGPNLRQLMDESPAGLGEQKAAFFLREIAKGLTYLHDCGIVHRDLKPANIFYENGYVKIGDYGLSKALTASQHSGHTMTVGTVHYMAPEVGAGKYDRSIDIYALGAVLFELLTGTPPFVGATPSEVLMKHLSVEVDVRGISQPFARVIQKAMAKDHVQRYATVQEMVEDVFGSQHVQQSMSVFSPEDLSIVAERVAGRVAAEQDETSSATVVAKPGARGQQDVWQRIARLAEPLAGAKPAVVGTSTADADPMPPFPRLIMAIGLVFAGAVAGTFLGGEGVATFPFSLMLIAGMVAGAMLNRHILLPRMAAETPLFRKMVGGGAVAGCALMLTWPFAFSGLAQFIWLVPILGPWFFFDLEKVTRIDRRERVQFWDFTFQIALFGVIASFPLGHHPMLSAATLVAATLALQLLVPWSPAGRPRPMPATGTPVQKTPAKSAPPPPARPRPLGKPVWRFAPMLWLVGFVPLLVGGIMMLVVAGVFSNLDDAGFTGLIAGGVSSILWAGLCLSRLGVTRFHGWWDYLVRPLVVVTCVQVIASTGIVMGNLPLSDDQTAIGVMIIVLFAVLLVVMAAIAPFVIRSLAGPRQDPVTAAPGQASPQQRAWALLLALMGMAGMNGLQRFYVGKNVSGIVWLLTLGLFGIGQLIDIIMILVGKFDDAQGRPLLHWEDSQDLDIHRLFSTWSVPGKQAATVAWRSTDAVPPPVDEPAQEVSRLTTRRSHIDGLLSSLASMLIFLTMVIGLAMALDLPAFISAGLPVPQAATVVERDVFNGYPQWPQLVQRLAGLATIVFMTVAVNAMIIARRSGGLGHMVRGAAGAALLPFALMPLESVFQNSGLWPQVSLLVQLDKVPAAVEMIVQRLEGMHSVVTLGIFLISIVLLAWPARQRAWMAPSPPALPRQRPAEPPPSPTPAQPDSLAGDSAHAVGAAANQPSEQVKGGV